MPNGLPLKDLETTLPNLRELVGSRKGSEYYEGLDPKIVVPVTYPIKDNDVVENTPITDYSIPSITTAKELDTALTEGGRMFTYDEANSKWILWFTFNPVDNKVYHNNTLTGDGSSTDKLSVNANVVALKSDLSDLFIGVDNGDGTYTFASKDGGTVFTIVTGVNFVEDIATLRNTPPKNNNDIVKVLGYYSDTRGVGSGDFYWDENSTEADNGGTIFEVVSVVTGRWKRFEKPYVDVKDFGARGDGITNDTGSMYNASQLIQSNDGGTLIIPKGTYIVGGQAIDPSPGTKYYQYKPIIDIRNCTNSVTIVGSGATLKVEDGMRFGAFDPETGVRYDPPSMPFTSQLYRIDTYSGVIYMNNCVSVTISDLEIDGNSDNIDLGGVWGDTGRQCRGSGIYIYDTGIIKLSNINCHHHPLDGMYLRSNASNEYDEAKNIFLENIICKYNARQGFSWTGGIGMFAVNCEFSKTGRGAFLSAPGAGMDIEPTSSICRNGMFINCRFEDNVSNGLVVDTGDSRDFTFLRCRFVGTTSYAMWPNKPGITFDDCLIVGRINNAYYTPNEEDATKFLRCHITDNPAYSETGAVYGSGGYLIDSKQNVLFEDCFIEKLSGKPLYSNGSIFRNNIIKAYAGTEVVVNKDFLMLFQNSELEDNKIYHYSIGTDPINGYYISSSNNKFKGNNIVQSDTGKLKWEAWTSNGFSGDHGISETVIRNKLILSRIGHYNNRYGNRGISYRAGAPPIGETPKRGDIIFNSDAAIGQPLGWICTVSGSTGTNATFVPFGILDYENYLDGKGYLTEILHDSLPADNPHSVTTQQTYEEAALTSTQTPDELISVEAGDVKTTPVVSYNVFNQNKRNSTTVTGTSEGSILNPNYGSTNLTLEDCEAFNSYELELIGELTWGGSTTGVDIKLKIGSNVETITIPLANTGTEPIKIEANLDFLDGIDTARTSVFTGNVIFIDDVGITNYIPIPETELTTDVSSGTTINVTFTGTDAVDSITINKAMLNRVIS